MPQPVYTTTDFQGMPRDREMWRCDSGAPADDCRPHSDRVHEAALPLSLLRHRLRWDAEHRPTETFSAPGAQFQETLPIVARPKSSSTRRRDPTVGGGAWRNDATCVWRGALQGTHQPSEEEVE